MRNQSWWVIIRLHHSHWQHSFHPQIALDEAIVEQSLQYLIKVMAHMLSWCWNWPYWLHDLWSGFLHACLCIPYPVLPYQCPLHFWSWYSSTKLSESYSYHSTLSWVAWWCWEWNNKICLHMEFTFIWSIVWATLFSSSKLFYEVSPSLRWYILRSQIVWLNDSWMLPQKTCFCLILAMKSQYSWPP